MQNEPYITLKIKSQTAGEFRIFCRKLGKQQSDSLQLMLDFFKNNRLSPSEELGPNFITLEKGLKVRINAVVAILKNIEKTQTKPSHAMLQLLFGENSVKKKELLLEKTQQEPAKNDHLQQEIVAYQNMESELRKKLYERTHDLKSVLDKVAVVRNNFGRIHLRLNLSREEYEQLKSKL